MRRKQKNSIAVTVIAFIITIELLITFLPVVGIFVLITAKNKVEKALGSILLIVGVIIYIYLSLDEIF